MDNYSNPLDRKAEKKEAWKEKWRWGFVAIIVVAGGRRHRLPDGS